MQAILAIADGGSAGCPHRFLRSGAIRVQQDGSVQALVGTQGHATTFAQIIASRLGVPMASIEIIEGDTDQVPLRDVRLALHRCRRLRAQSCGDEGHTALD